MHYVPSNVCKYIIDCLISPVHAYKYSNKKKNTPQTILTIKILSTIDEKGVFSPNVDHGWVLLHQS